MTVSVRRRRQDLSLEWDRDNLSAEELRGPCMERGAEMGIKERSEQRRRRIVANRAASFEEAERWDLEFWQNLTPEERLSALVAIRRDVEKVNRARSLRRRRSKRED
jgi:hypothetical protein